MSKKITLAGYFFAVCLAMLSFSLSAQKLYPEQPDDFIKTYTAGGDTTALKILALWDSGIVGEDEKQLFIHSANQLALNKFQYNPAQILHSTIFINLKKENHPVSFPLKEFYGVLDTTIQLAPPQNTLRYLQFLEKYTRTGKIFENENNGNYWISTQPQVYFLYNFSPTIHIDNTTLKYITPRDSLVVHNTSGLFYVIPSMFIGIGGKMTWERVNLNPNEVYCELDTFQLPIKEGGIKAENVSFYYKSKFPNAIKGTFHDEVVSYSDYTQAQFPFFQSYDLVNEISKPEDYYVYSGGFTLRGMHIGGSGSINQNATIKIVKNPQVPIKVQAQNFKIESDLIASGNASVTIYLIDKNGETDSIYHPSVDFKYEIPKRKISLWRNPKSADKKIRAPFTDSYHRLDLYFEAIYWNLDSAFLNLKNIIDQLNNKAILQSEDFFNRTYFKYSKGLLTSHPVSMVYQYKQNFPDKDILLTDLCNYMKQTPEVVERVILDLNYWGYFQYNPETQEIVLTEKGIKMAEAAAKKKDFDSMRIESTLPSGYNAQLNLKTFELKMRGIHKFYIGDSVNIAIESRDSAITFLKNRDMLFDGKVESMKADFYGRGCYFSYADYLIRMEKIDSIRYITKTDADLRAEKSIQFEPGGGEPIKGILYIEKSNNKNGNKRNFEYPIFESHTTSYAYWDAQSIRKGVYKRNKFYFEVYPYTIDSLDDIKLTTLVFPGKFYSDIFPAFEETLRVQENYSVGFTTEFKKGMTVYQKENDNGKFYNTLRLDDNGLTGNGKVDYLSSTTESHEFIFYPDSVRALGNSFHIAQGVYKGISYPSVQGAQVDFFWLPRKDKLIVKNILTPLDMYNTFASLTGILNLAPKGLTGNGEVSINDGRIISPHFSFEQKKFRGDSARFRLLNPDKSEKDFFTIHDITFNYNIPSKSAVFDSYFRGITAAEFPYNLFATSILNGTWNTDKGNIALISTVGSAEDYYFQSTKPKQEALIFTARGAFFTTNTKRVDVSGVPYILIADALIYPDSGNVRIHKDAEIEKLIGAKITANFSTKYFNFYDADVQILERFDYSATAAYNYIDAKRKEQKLRYSIKIDAEKKSTGYSLITKEQNFTVLPRIQFYGTATFRAEERFQQFTGNIALILQDGKKTSWVKYDAKVNPDSSYIPLKNPMDENGFPLTVGMHFQQDRLALYSTFLSVKERGADGDIITAEGALTFDEPAQEFRVGSRNRLGGRTLAESIFRYNDVKGELLAEGTLQLPFKLGQVESKTAGQIKHNLKNRTFTLNMLWTLQFELPKEAWAILAPKFLNELFIAKDANLRTAEFVSRITEMLGENKAEKVISEAKSMPAPQVDLRLDYTLVLDDVYLIWNDTLKTFHSVRPFVLSSMNRQNINKYINGYIEVLTGVESDTIKIYLQLRPDAWVFFKFSHNLAQVSSTYENFNEIIKKESPVGSTTQVLKAPPNYIFAPAQIGEKEEFVKNFLQNYLGIKKE